LGTYFKFTYDPLAGLILNANSAFMQDGYLLHDLILGDSGYIQSKMTYTPMFGLLSNYSVNYTYTNQLNNRYIPEQLPYNGISANYGYLTATVLDGIPSPLYIAEINGYHAFSANKYLISSVNGYAYQYVFDSDGRVSEIRNDQLTTVGWWISLEYN
jgi:hypothetical protein